MEDEKALRVATARILAGHGYEVVVASDGVEALEIYRRTTRASTCVVTDMAMPRMRGDELARLVSERGRRPRVIMMTGYDPGDGSLPDWLLPKPVAEDGCCCVPSGRSSMTG